MAKAFGDVARRAIRTAAGREESRQKMVGAVHAASKRLGIAEEDRKALQLEATGKASLSDMDLGEIGKVLDRLNRDYKGPSGQRATAGKIRALWWTLYWLGAAGEPNDAAIDAFVKRQTGKERLRFLGHKEAFRVVEALKSWAAREGVSWPTDARLAELAALTPGLTMAQLERHAVIDAIGARLRQRGLLHTFAYSYCERPLGLGCNHWLWTPRELDAAIRMLGKKLRRDLDKKGGEE